MLGSLLRSLFNLVCGSSTTEEEKPHRPQHETAPQQGRPQKQQYPPQQQHQQQPHQQHRPQEQRPPRHERPVHHGKQSDPNLINQSNPQYLDLRAQANKEGDAMARAFEESHSAYAGGDGARAKELSNEGKAHQRRMEELNKKAADWIYVENNKDSQPGEVDLHGLYVKEAIERTESAIEDAKRRGDHEVHLIVGKGLHSQGNAAKIKPAIEQLMVKHNLVADLDPDNAGVLVVQIGGGDQRGVDPDEIARRLDRNGEGCVVM